MDPNYEPPKLENRQVYGISLQQNRNDAKITADGSFNNIVTNSKNVS